MYKSKNLIDKWHLAGFFWIVIVGSLLHFTYEWSAYSNLVAVFSAINESVWEHLKLGYFALSFFILIEYWFLRKETENYALAKTVGIIDMSLFIVIFHYAYKFIFKRTSVIYEIGLFIVGALICQYLSSRIMKKKASRSINRAAFIVYIVIGILFGVFTFYPPNFILFKEAILIMPFR